MIRPVTSEADISRLIQADGWMMDVLQVAETLDLPDWWIGAGFLRNKVWNYMEAKDSEQARDVDLVYFNGSEIAPETDWAYDEQLASDYPFAQWEVRNQARMHYKNDFDPYTSTADGIAHWTETATAVAVCMRKGSLDYLFCYATDDLFNLVARPTPYFQTENGLKLFHDRIHKKQWLQKWPDLRVIADLREN